MNMNLAAQILSHSVIKSLATCEELPEEAIYIAQFVERFGNLFNTFSSDTQQLRESVKFVAANKLFVQNTESNCIADDDKFLLDVSSISIAKYVKSVLEDIEPPSNMDMIYNAVGTTIINLRRECSCLIILVFTQKNKS